MNLTAVQARQNLAYRYNGGDAAYAYANKWWLTAPMPLQLQHDTSLARAFYACRSAVVVAIYDYYPSCYAASIAETFASCSSLKYIIGYPIELAGITDAQKVNNAFAGCVALMEVRLQNLKVSISFKDSPHLSLQSIQFMVEKTANTTPITITVHPTVYTKLTDESNEEWNSLLTLAASKNIQFATV